MWHRERLRLTVVAGALSLPLGACDSNGQNPCYCPARTTGWADIWLPCGATNVTAQATGVCTASVSQGEIAVTGDGTDGRCTVDVSIGGSAPTSYLFQFSTQWLACGGDPHGCGQSTYATPSQVQIGSQCGSGSSSGGVDAGGVD